MTLIVFCTITSSIILSTSIQLTLATFKNRRTLSSLKSNFNMNLESIKFDNRNLRSLPVEGVSSVYETVFTKVLNSNSNIANNPRKISRQIPNSIFTYTELQPVRNPQIVCISPEALQLLGLPYKEYEDYTENEIKLLSQYFSGSLLIPGTNPAAHVYCGHQFGSFAGYV